MMKYRTFSPVFVLAVLLSSLCLRLRPGYVPEPKLRVTLRPARGMPMRLTACPGDGGKLSRIPAD